MAFQTGTRVNPRLGRLDFSGFTNAANIQAASLAQLGKSIGEGFEKYQENKQITAASLSALEALSIGRPEVYAQVRDSDTDIGKKLRNIENGKYNAKDAQQVVGGLQTLIIAQDAQQASELRDLQLEKTALDLATSKREDEQAQVSASAFDQAIFGNTIVDGGGLVTEKIRSDYISAGGRDANDLKIIGELEKLDGPNIEVIEIDGFKVVTQDGRYMTASKDGQEAQGKRIEEIKFRTEERQRARKLHREAQQLLDQGNETEARNKLNMADDILAANNYKDEYGRPMPAEKEFGSLKRSGDEDSDNSLIFDPSTLSEADRQLYNKLSENDKEAFEFAIKNPNDPRSKEILDGFNNVN